jgi:hypothetical protein
MINVGISFRSEDVYSRKACDAQWANFMSELIDRWDKCALCVKKLEDLLLCDDWNRNLSKPFLFGLDPYYESHGYVLGEFSLAYAKIAMNRPVRNSVIHYVNYIHSNRKRMETLYQDFEVFCSYREQFSNVSDRFHHAKDILKLMDEFKDHLWDLRRADAKYAMDHVSRTEEFLKRDGLKDYPEVPTIIDNNASKRLQNRHYKRGLREIVTLCLLFDGKDRQMKKLKTQAKKAEEERYDKDFISLEELVQAYDGLTKVLMEREKLLLMEENKTKEEDQYGLY